MHGLYRPAWQRKDRQKRALSLSTLKKRSWKRSTVNYYLFVFLLFSLFQLAQATSSHHHHQSHSHSRTLGRERRSETGKKRLQLGARQLSGAEVSPGEGTATDAAANGDNQAIDVARATDALTDSSVNNSTITDAQTTTSQSSDSETATPSQTSSDTVKRTSSSSSSDSTTSTTSPTTTPIPPSTPAPITTPSFTSTPTPPPTATPPPKKAEQGLISFLFDKRKNKFFPAVIAGCVLIGSSMPCLHYGIQKT
ncbi:hypothetical protein BT69DRAFT_351251 [Atractiella rhizophila]|nr:hypothetical protein BT69DRAFT_351251 [Atractiella rhizophila]